MGVMKGSSEEVRFKSGKEAEAGKPELAPAGQAVLAKSGLERANTSEDKKKERESDIWDIPTFLRKRKK